jgi:hypothetical protein
MAVQRRPREYREGPEAGERFDDAMKRLLSVPKEELAKREAAYQKSREQKDRPGPRKRDR